MLGSGPPIEYEVRSPSKLATYATKKTVKVKAHTKRLVSASNKVLDRSNSIVREVPVIGHSVQSLPGTSLVVRAWSYECMVASVRDILFCGVEAEKAAPLSGPPLLAHLNEF